MRMKQPNKNKEKRKLTSSAEIHWMADCVVSVDAERHQDVRRRIRDQNLIFFFLISPKNQTKQKKNKKRIRIHGRQNERSSSSAQTIMDSLYCFWTVQRIYRSSPHLREADDFAGDVSRVPGDRDFPHNVRQNANHADA